jgi:hypothetical protein
MDTIIPTLCLMVGIYGMCLVFGAMSWHNFPRGEYGDSKGWCVKAVNHHMRMHFMFCWYACKLRVSFTNTVMSTFGRIIKYLAGSDPRVPM